jgi:hypothetical protein
MFFLANALLAISFGLTGAYRSLPANPLKIRSGSLLQPSSSSDGFLFKGRNIVGPLCMSTNGPRKYSISKPTRENFVENMSTIVSKVSSDDDEEWVPGSEEDELTGLPDKEAFVTFYKKTVKAGKEMRLDQFMRYTEVAALLDEELVKPDDLDDLWVSAVGDATGLNESEAYEMLCMVLDIPEPQDEDFLDKEFQMLTGDKETLSFMKFLAWEDMQAILEEEALSMEEVTNLWREVAGGLDTPIDRKLFSKLNAAIDTALDEDDEGSEDDDTDLEGNGDEEEIDLSGVDIWDPSFDPKEVFDDTSLKEITEFYSKAAGLKGIKFDDVCEWDDVQDMLNEGLVTRQQLQDAWKLASKGKKFVDLDAFIRFNLKLDLMVEEAEGADEDGADDEDESAEVYYREQFRKVTEGGRLMRLDMLLGWEEVADLIKDSVLTRKQVSKMFEGLPKEPMGIPSDVFGITEDTFVAFNSMLDMVMDAAGATEASGVTSTPAPLVAVAPRPMPSEKELKIGSLGGNEDDAAAELSQSELDLMETLDKADNMLNSGSFSDFDQLVGDMNDPRLAALRVKDLNAEAISGRVEDLLTELLTLTREQKRCGLDKPSEEDAARMRDLIQAVIEQSPRAATRDIKALTTACTGKWKLLYTNSEMFDFYNGITGFVNVVCSTTQIHV